MTSYVASKSALGAWLSAYRLDVRRLGIQVLDARPGHTETGLATRPLFGVAPKFPAGLEPRLVAEKTVQAIELEEETVTY
jgi:cyclic-di-GMP-binding biofilm dispersal mediator protein